MRTTLQWVLRLTGAGLLVATAAMHLDLYLTGFRTIPTIGPLFLFQVIVGFALALAILAAPFTPVTRRPAVDASIAAVGAGYAIATLGGYLLSLWVGLFGFHEIRSTAGTVAGILEIAAFGVLLGLAVLVLDPQWLGRSGDPAHRRAPGPLACAGGCGDLLPDRRRGRGVRRVGRDRELRPGGPGHRRRHRHAAHHHDRRRVRADQ